MHNIVVPNKLNGIYSLSQDLDSYLCYCSNTFETICNKRFKSIQEIYDFLEEPDALTDSEYGAPDEKGLYDFPLSFEPYDDKVKTPPLFHGKVGDQTSCWHNETLKQHAALTTCNLVEAGVRKEDAAVLGVLHDCGKKYTARTNVYNGKVCFPEHENLSALLAGWWTKSWGVTDERRHLWMAIIYGHIRFQEWQNSSAKSTKDKNTYIKEVSRLFGNEEALRAYGLVYLLGVSNEGVKEGAIIDLEKVKRGEEIIKSVLF